MTDESEQPVLPAPPLDQVAEGAEPNPAATPPGAPYIVIHSNSEGHYFATRVRSTSKSNAMEAIGEVHKDNTALTAMDDQGILSLRYEGADLTVEDLSDEP